MQDINWACCPRVAQNPVARAFIEQMARERKAASTIENYSRGLDDFLTAFVDVPFVDVLEADEARIAHYIDWLFERDARRGYGHKGDTRNKLSLTTIRRRVSTVRVFYAWCIRLRHRRDGMNPVREGVRGQARGAVPRPRTVPWILDERQWMAIVRYTLTALSIKDQLLEYVDTDGRRLSGLCAKVGVPLADGRGRRSPRPSTTRPKGVNVMFTPWRRGCILPVGSKGST